MSEYKMLMALRKLFGRDSLLWKHSSLEDLCHDWLEFKAQEPGKPFSAFVRLLMSVEEAENPDPEKRMLFCERIENFLLKCDLDGITGRPWGSRKWAPLLDLSFNSVEIAIVKPSTHLPRSRLNRQQRS